jgi:hypothetical protein
VGNRPSELTHGRSINGLGREPPQDLVGLECPRRVACQAGIAIAAPIRTSRAPGAMGRALARKVLGGRRRRRGRNGVVVKDVLEDQCKSAEARFRVLHGRACTWTVERGQAAPTTRHPRFGQSMVCEVMSLTPAAPLWPTRFRCH